MPAAMTYDSLVTDIENYLQRYDTKITNQIPRFIMLAQQRIPREMKILGFREIVTGQIEGDTLTTGILPKPAGWRKTIAFYIGTGTNGTYFTPVFERTSEYIRTLFPDVSVVGEPRFYGDEDYDHWLLGPTPQSAYNFRIPYYSTLNFLDVTTQENWLTVNAPDLLLYACLLEAAPFVKTDERIQIWQGFYMSAKVALQAQEAEGKYDTQSVVGEPQPPSVLPK